ncbi:MAG TPA: hypothetical protein VL334_19055 [Anaerolineae bacterium]|nr:hypothetical protein [Anaerolineae bacterium]
MTRYPQLSPDEIDGLLDQCRCALDALSPALGVAGGRLLAEHPPRQWPVEWHLPWWLAAGLGLAEADWRALTVCNLLGLGYVRMEDRLAEGMGVDASLSGAAVLAGACHELALAGLAELLPATPDFWRYRHLFMAHWLRSLSEDDGHSSLPFAAWQEQDLARLAWRGAPLKISAVGACLLADRGDLIPTLMDALDQLLIAQVLLDHVDDWRDDLAGGRFNVFVAYASGFPQDCAHVEANGRRVLTLLMMGDPGDYFQLIQRHAARARSLAVQVGCSGLAEFVASLQSEADLGCSRLVDAGRDHLRQAVSGVLHV